MINQIWSAISLASFSGNSDPSGTQKHFLPLIFNWVTDWRWIEKWRLMEAARLIHRLKTECKNNCQETVRHGAFDKLMLCVQPTNSKQVPIIAQAQVSV